MTTWSETVSSSRSLKMSARIEHDWVPLTGGDDVAAPAYGTPLPLGDAVETAATRSESSAVSKIPPLRPRGKL
jgi:hypothetical protein